MSFQYIHQLGSRINSYTTALFGDKGTALSRKRSAPARNYIPSNSTAASFRNVDSFVSVKSALTVPVSHHRNYTPQDSIEVKGEKDR